jgi:serine/threonine-protein kinase
MANEGSNRVGDYEVLALLGTGGMGRVFKVRNVITNREEAMKVLLPDFASEPELANRFMAEIRTLAALDHPNIAQLRTAFQVENQFVMVMEYVEGATLDKLAAEKRIPIEQVVEYSMQVLSALSYAHGRGVIHRDIKPGNIMITSHGLAKLMDFGIAKSAVDMQLTRPGTTMGSMYYMSPEQVRGDTVDARSDIYSFGVTLYEMLTGKKPFESDTSFSVLNAHVNEAPAPPMQMNPELPQALNDIVLCAMAKKPAERFQSAEEFRNALKALREPRTERVAQAAPVPVPVPVATAEAQAAPQATQAGWQSVPPVAQRVQQPVAQPVQQQAAQGFAPVAAVAPAARPNAGKSHRGLWIMVGALTAILALVAVVALLPRIFSTYATQKPAATAANTPTPAPSPDAKGAEQNTPATDATQPAAAAGTATAAGTTATPATASSTATKPAATTKAGAAPRPVYNPQRQGPAPGASSPAAASSASAPSTPAVPAGPSAQEIREAHDRLMNLDAEAEAASSGVQGIRNQQQAQGLNMRGDILASMARMNNYLGSAKRSLGQNDLTAANEYMEKADKEISTLDKFLGR